METKKEFHNFRCYFLTLWSCSFFCSLNRAMFKYIFVFSRQFLIWIYKFLRNWFALNFYFHLPLEDENFSSLLLIKGSFSSDVHHKKGSIHTYLPSLNNWVIKINSMLLLHSCPWCWTSQANDPKKKEKNFP